MASDNETPPAAAETQNQILGILGDLAKTAVGNLTQKQAKTTPTESQRTTTAPVDWQKWAIYGAVALVVVLIAKKILS